MMTRTHWSRDTEALAKVFSYLSCQGKHDFQNPVPLTEILNETNYVTRKGQRFFCTNCGWHKDVFWMSEEEKVKCLFCDEIATEGCLCGPCNTLEEMLHERELESED